MKIFYWLAISSLFCFLTSCSLFSPVPAESGNKYVLNTLPPSQIKKPHRSTTLMVAEPNTTTFYDTTLMAYSLKHWQLAYFSKNTWSSRPSEMIQPLIVQSLQNTHYFHAVITPAVSGGYDYLLNTQLTQFVQDFSYPRPVFRLTVTAEIIRASTNKIVASKQFVIAETLQQRSPYAGVLAANQATEVFLRQLTMFCLQHV